jgi:hypothetical protein
MPRTARHIESNGYYRVISRSINQTWIYKDDEDFLYFRKLVLSAKHKFPIRLFHYVFMNTHFHFVLQALNKEILAKTCLLSNGIMPGGCAKIISGKAHCGEEDLKVYL